MTLFTAILALVSLQTVFGVNVLEYDLLQIDQQIDLWMQGGREHERCFGLMLESQKFSTGMKKSK